MASESESSGQRRRSSTRPIWLLALAAGAGLVAASLPGWTKRGALAPSQAGTPVHGYRIVREYPHDPEAFTQGLIYWNGFLYESTAPTGRSSLREVRLDTSEVVMRWRLNDTYFHLPAILIPTHSRTARPHST